ncbi:MAG: hypothetical protein M8844_06935, partial [marine benthic group bacterium]|nr:hypothetical protein [Gemmatimonadota bacterium]
MQIHSIAWRLGRWFAGAFALAGLLLAVPGGVGSLSAQEFIIHANGDSINGDVKGFQRGKLEFEIPGGSATFIEFDDIATIG